MNQNNQSKAKGNMTFEIYKPVKKVRHIIDESHITINGGNRMISFGQHKPPHDYLAIAYDMEKKMVKFLKGNSENGYSYKVGQNKHSGSYNISPRMLIENGLLPVGLYKKCGDMTYKFVRR